MIPPSRIESSATMISLEVLDRLCQALKCEPGDILVRKRKRLMAEETTATLKPFADFSIEESRDSQAWRYIDFPKLASLVQTKRLVFPTVDGLTWNDPWEGALDTALFNHINRSSLTRSQ